MLAAQRVVGVLAAQGDERLGEMLVDLVLGLVLRRELCRLAQLLAVPIGELALDDAPRRHLLELGIERLRAGVDLRPG